LKPPKFFTNKVLMVPSRRTNYVPSFPTMPVPRQGSLLVTTGLSTPLPDVTINKSRLIYPNPNVNHIGIGSALSATNQSLSESVHGKDSLDQKRRLWNTHRPNSSPADMVVREALYEADAEVDPSVLMDWEVFVEDIGVGIITSFSTSKYSGTQFEVQFQDQVQRLVMRGPSGAGNDAVVLSLDEPGVLMGWEVLVEDMGVGVITSFSKSKFLGTQFEVQVSC